MTNYEHIMRLMPAQLAEFLEKFNRDKTIDEHCRNCEMKNNGCPVDKDEPCEIPLSEILLWWLNQIHKEGKNEG